MLTFQSSGVNSSYPSAVAIHWDKRYATKPEVGSTSKRQPVQSNERYKNCCRPKSHLSSTVCNLSLQRKSERKYNGTCIPHRRLTLGVTG